MTKIVVLALIALFSLLIPIASSAAETRPYVGLFFGPIIQIDSDFSNATTRGVMETDAGLAIGGMAGVEFEKVRLEAEISYQNISVESLWIEGEGRKYDGDLTLLNCIANAYLLFPTAPPLRPFLFAGVGVSRGHITEIRFNGNKVFSNSTDYRLAYQVGTGVSYQVGRNVSLEAAYKYLRTGDFDFAGTKSSYSSHNALFAVRYMF